MKCSRGCFDLTPIRFSFLGEKSLSLEDMSVHYSYFVISTVSPLGKNRPFFFFFCFDSNTFFVLDLEWLFFFFLSLNKKTFTI